jgi:hypothetical protein
LPPVGWEQPQQRPRTALDDVAEVCVEAYLAEVDAIVRSVSSLHADLEGADSHARLVLNASRNSIWTTQIALSSAMGLLSFAAVVGNLLGMNLGNRERAEITQDAGLFIRITAATSAVVGAAMLVGWVVIARML